MQAASPAARKSLGEALTPYASPAIAAFAIFAVHRLTRSREREKFVFELHKNVGDALGTLKASAIKAWTDAGADQRQAAVADTLWRLQQIGGFVERMRRLSRRWGWRNVGTPGPLRWRPRSLSAQAARWWHWRSLAAGTVGVIQFLVTWLRHLMWPPGWIASIALTRAMSDLRDAITADPFDDPQRGPDPNRHEQVETAVGTFLEILDRQLFDWMG